MDQAQQHSVLIIDDDPLIRLQACGFLSQAGFIPAEAADGAEALSYLAQATPDLIILDVEMPGVNGFAVCREIRQMQEFTHTPILMLTGLNDRQSIDEAYNAGATDFAVKPINWSLLTHRLLYMHRASEAAGRIHQVAFYDTLTGLPNRVLFQEKLDSAMQEASETNRCLAILCFDLDDFKRINDNFGHAIGDRLLQKIGNRIKESLRETRSVPPSLENVVARMGGDEFTVILNAIGNIESAISCAERLIRAIANPVLVDGYKLFTSASIGIAITSSDNNNADSLLKKADMAMYEAKRNGKGVYALYNDELDAKAHRRFQIDEQMRSAVEQREFSIFYQPQLDLFHGSLVCAEALLRWTNPLLGVISPAEFISVAEDNGMIVPIGEWVLRNACFQAKNWQDTGFEIQRIAVNVSALQFMRPDFPDIVRTALKDSGLCASRLEIEITETLLASNVNHAVDTLNSLKRLGVQLSIDDFGTGFSSLNQLKRFPIDRLKIDQSFIRNITNDNNDASITKAVIAMSKSMGIRVLAEGVETAEQLEFLRQSDCDEIQGYYISKPKAADDLESSLPELLSLVNEHFPSPKPTRKDATIYQFAVPEEEQQRKVG